MVSQPESVKMNEFKGQVAVITGAADRKIDIAYYFIHSLKKLYGFSVGFRDTIFSFSPAFLC